VGLLDAVMQLLGPFMHLIDGGIDRTGSFSNRRRFLLQNLALLHGRLNSFVESRSPPVRFRLSAF
jgi:hypothetical protein